jgi:hypothetical protein
MNGDPSLAWCQKAAEARDQALFSMPIDFLIVPAEGKTPRQSSLPQSYNELVFALTEGRYYGALSLSEG